MSTERQQRRLSGGTLVEVVAVLGLLAILVAAAMSALPWGGGGVSVAAGQLAAHLRYVQGRALADVSPWVLDLPTASSWRLGRVGGGWERLPASTLTVHTLDGGITVSGATEVRFDPWGRPVASDGTPLGSDVTLTVSDGSQSRSVVVIAGTGLIR